MYRLRVSIERLRPDTSKVRTLEHAHKVVAALLDANQDRDIRVTLLDMHGTVLHVVERKASSFAPCVNRQETGFYRPI